MAKSTLKSNGKTAKSSARAPSPTPSEASSSSGSIASSVDSDDIDAAPVVASTSKQRKVKPGERLYYEPPPGMDQVRINVNYNSVFEWDRLNQGDCELWAVRLPVDLKPSHLSGLSTRIAGDSVSGSLSYKGKSFKLQPSEEVADLDSLNLLVPKKSSGHLYRAPRPIKRHLLLVPDEDVVPSSRKKLENENRSTGPIPNKPRSPPRGMKFRNPVNGFDTPGPDLSSRARAAPAAAVEETPKRKKAKTVDTKEDEKEDRKEKKTPKDKEKKKKRKSDVGADTPSKKKSK